MHGLRCKGLILALLLALATPAFCTEWYQSYQKGQDAIKKGDCAKGKQLMLEALKKYPNDELNAHPYGTFLLEYIPHFYLFQCAVLEGDVDAANQYMKAAEAGGVSSSSKAAEFRQLKSKMPQQKTTQPEVVPQQKPPVNTTPPTNTTTTQPPPPQDNKQAQIAQALKEARDALSVGDYDRAKIAAYRASALSPNQPEARRILQEIETRERSEQQARERREKLDQAARALKSGDLATATSLSNELQSKYPDDTQVQALAREIQNQAENQKPPQQTEKENSATVERQVVVSFYKGQYSAAIELAQQGLAKFPDSWRLNFFLGCSYASLALMEKENHQNLGLAGAAFAKAKSIDSTAVLPPLISPKILTIYNKS